MRGRWHRRSLKTRIFLLLLLILSLFLMFLYIRPTFYGDHHFSIVKLRWDESNSFRRGGMKYPKRHNMNECPRYFGNVTVFVSYTGKLKQHGMYDVAQRSLECYLKTVNYTLLAVDLDNDIRVNESCSLHKSIFYKKHCAVLQYLPETDWMLVLDADTGIVNPDHCIEEYIDDRVSVLLIERFFNWEFAAGNYLKGYSRRSRLKNPKPHFVEKLLEYQLLKLCQPLDLLIVKNSPFAYHFLRSWVDYEFKQKDKSWHGNDQGGLMLNVLGLLLPHAEHEYNVCEHYWKAATDYGSYMKVVTCVRFALGSERLWSGKIRIFNRAHGFVRDGWLTKQMWSPEDFMFHGWKKVGRQKAHPFSKVIDPEKCGVGLHGWHWNQKYRKTAIELRSALQKAESYYRKRFPAAARIIPLLDAFSVSSCYPRCETV